MSDLVELKIKGDPRNVKANRFDLVRESLYFKAMFSENFLEQEKTTIELGLEGVISYEILTTIVQFMTSGTITPTKDTIAKIILSADFFQMDNLKESLVEMLTSDSSIIDPSNVLHLWQLTMSQNSVSIRDVLEEYIKDNFLSVAYDISFVRLDVESVRKILEWDNLKVQSEKEILFVIKMWINFAIDERKKNFSRLLRCVRLDDNIEEKFLNDNILTYCSCVACADFVSQYLKLQDEPLLVVGIDTVPRNFQSDREEDYYDFGNGECDCDYVHGCGITGNEEIDWAARVKGLDFDDPEYQRVYRDFLSQL